MGDIVLACLLAGGLGLVAGLFYLVLGWMLVGSLLFLTTVVALLVAGSPLIATLGWIGATLVAFNFCLLATLMVRYGVMARRA